MSKARVAPPRPAEKAPDWAAGHTVETGTLKAHALGIKACLNAIAACDWEGLSKDDQNTVAVALLCYADRRADDILRELEELRPLLGELVSRLPKDKKAVA